MFKSYKLRQELKKAQREFRKKRKKQVKYFVNKKLFEKMDNDYREAVLRDV